jgi:FKBP-type peptidyl-prolyl cis-trans isomerase FkpA
MTTTYWKYTFFFIASLALTSCKTYSEEDKKTLDTKIETYLKKDKTHYQKSESGLYYFIEKEGEGAFIKFTDEIEINYQGKLLNGQIFDGEHKKNPIKFKVADLIEGWKEGMLYLKKGGKAKLIIPPYLGYGDYDLEKIPPHSVLVFEIEVLDVK